MLIVTMFLHISVLNCLCVVKMCSSQIPMLPVFVNESVFKPRVVGGERVKLGEVPYQVALMSRVKGSLFAATCGGSIIGRSKILTAAHCLPSEKRSVCYKSVELPARKLSNYAVVAGYLYSRGLYNYGISGGEGQWRKLRSATYPTTYDFPSKDICVVMLEKPLKFNLHVGPIGMAKKFQDYRGTCLASGYGLLRITDRPKYEDVSSYLLKANLEIITKYWCSKMYRGNMKPFVCTTAGPPIVAQMLKRPFIFNSEVNKISYARTYEDYRGPCLASGYGRISNRFAMTSDILLKAHLTMITTYWCNTKFRRNMKALVCTATTPTDISKGDSGGPLVCTGTRQPSESRHGVLVGVASGSRLRVATFFTRVSSFSKYIARNRSGTSYFKSRCLVLVSFGVYGFLIG